MIAVNNLNAEMAKLGAAMRSYVDASGKALDEVLPKKANDLAWALWKRLRAIAPEKGSIRTRGEQLLKAGRGVRVRRSIRDRADARFVQYDDLAQAISSGAKLTARQFNRALKWGARTNARTRKVTFTNKLTGGKSHRRLNWWELAVALELSARESARGFLSLTPPRRIDRLRPGQRVVTKGRYQNLLASASSATGERKVTFTWGDLSGPTSAKAAKGMAGPKAQGAMMQALRDVTADLQQYIERKLAAKLAGVKL